ncbi:MAG: hypothetical protein QG608_270 [Actinomycetota bacterium]|nr:hypothetical protein [Actinomycetota bacterium]
MGITHTSRGPTRTSVLLAVALLVTLTGCSGAGHHGRSSRALGASGDNASSRARPGSDAPGTGPASPATVPPAAPGGSAKATLPGADPGVPGGTRSAGPTRSAKAKARDTGDLVLCAAQRTPVVLDRSTRSGTRTVIRLRFRNRGMQPCLLRGGPTVTFLDGMGSEIGLPLRAGYSPAARAVLTLGGTATATVRAPDPAAVPESSCRSVPVSRIRVRTSPDGEAAMLTYSGRLCADPTRPTVIGPYTRS